MKSEKRRSDEQLEKALAEVLDAERAGVFRNTMVQSVRESSGIPLVGSPRFWVPLAAAAALAFGVWGLMFARYLGEIREQAAQNSAILRTESLAVAFSGCMNGPGIAGNATCARLDLDSDGDVDLADFSRSQLASASNR